MTEILGSNKAVMFCEGADKNSIDFKVYNALFCDDYTVIPVGGHDSVEKYCSVLNDADWIGESHITIANRMNSAILSILESLKPEDLSSILEAYYLYEIAEKKIDVDEVRISFSNIQPNIFPNIASVVNRLSKEKRIHLP